jgi:hypothetical protein
MRITQRERSWKGNQHVAGTWSRRTQNQVTRLERARHRRAAAHIVVRVDVRPYHLVYHDDGSVNARCAFYCYNPPIPGKKITVQAWIADKYARRGKNYIVTQAVSVDEDGRLLDRVITHELKQPSEVGKKWQ